MVCADDGQESDAHVSPNVRSISRRPAQERIALVQAVAELGYIEVDRQARLVLLDPAAQALCATGSACDVELAYEQWLGCVAEPDQLRARALFESTLPPGETERLTIRLAGGDPRKPRLLEFALRADPATDHLVGTCRDVTRERSLEDLRRQKASAERANHAKSEFMSHVSHELRTPLNAILGFTQMMVLDRDHPLPPAQRERLQLVERSSRRLLGLIDQLLQINRIERGRRVLSKRAISVATTVRHCVDALQFAARDRDVSFEFDIDNPKSAAVRADPQAFEQIVTNLLSNAIKYNRDGGRIRVRFRSLDIGELVIDDTGMGMSDSQLGQLFEPFKRLHADKAQIQGTGLGLVITRELVHAMGGSLQVQSELGVGSRFIVHLPLASRPRARDNHTLPLELPSQWNGGGRCRVLYIEDDEVNLLLMEQVFSTQPDWHLHHSLTGSEGVKDAMRIQPDLILLDMNLPDMSGQEVFKRLQSDPRTRHLRCVAVTADALPEQLAQARALGFDDYWTKPLDLPAVIMHLKKMLC